MDQKHSYPSNPNGFVEKKMKKTEGKDVPEDADILLDEIARKQIKANYRKSLGMEHARRSWDVEIEKIFKKKRQE